MNIDNNSRSTSGWVLVSRSATSCGQSISWAVVIACFLCSSDFDGSLEEPRDDHLLSGYDTPGLTSRPARTPLCWTQPVMSEAKEVQAALAAPDERPSLWQRLVAMHPYFTEYQQRTRRAIPVVTLTPVTT